jgi:predicted amidophosphoribosyltransferase
VQHLFDFFIPPTQQEERVRSYTLADVPVSPQTHSESATSITTLWKYDEPKVRDTIWALKYRKSAAAATLCAQALEEYLADVVSEASLMQETRPCVVIPIPLSKERLRERGYNELPRPEGTGYQWLR